MANTLTDITKDIYMYILVNVIERKKENILLRVTINNLITYNAATL